MKISVIIVNHNTPKLVEDCIISLRQYLAEEDLEVIVVNNGKDLYRGLDGENWLRSLTVDQKMGFGASNNYGVARSSGEILWFLNSDALVVDSSMKRLFGFIKKEEKIGIASPMLYLDKDLKKPQRDFIARRQTLKTLIFRRARPVLDLQHKNFARADVVAGASMVMRREVFKRLGGFDENIFMYLEDDDLCYRAQKAGYKVGIFTGTRVVHLQGQSIRSNQQRKRLYYQSQNYFWRKHYGAVTMWLMRFLRWPLKFVKTI